jgi:hypothetical protein
MNDDDFVDAIAVVLMFFIALGFMQLI